MAHDTNCLEDGVRQLLVQQNLHSHSKPYHRLYVPAHVPASHARHAVGMFRGDDEQSNVVFANKKKKRKKKKKKKKKERKRERERKKKKKKKW